VVTSVTLSVVEKQKLQIVRTHSKITQIKQEKIQSYASLQAPSNECRLSAYLQNMSAHDAIKGLPPFKIEFLPLQAIFDDFVLIFCSKLASKVSTEAH
jgi:hypothetical protein